MNKDNSQRIGLIIGNENDWPEAFMQGINQGQSAVTAELIKLSGTLMSDTCPYHLIIDRLSHEVPYYRVYLKFAALQGCYVINNPFTWSSDDKFLGLAIANRLGLTSPKTVVLPNKHITKELGPDCFRNLEYPMDWQGIIDYVGVPAIFKDVHSGGRLIAYRVHNVDELIQRYDESGRHTMILQEVIESDTHIHCYVTAQKEALLLRYSHQDDNYHPDMISMDMGLNRQLRDYSLALSRVYGYDINMVEFVIRDDRPFVINSTNPTPVIDLKLMTEEQFQWCVDRTVELAIERVNNPLPGYFPVNLELA